MADDDQTIQVDLRDVEAELCRLPDVLAARIVSDDLDRPVEVHVLAQTGKHPKQIVRDVQSVALASFGVELDRRIVSVVQLGPDGSEEPAAGESSGRARTRIVELETLTRGVRSTVRVTLGLDVDEATGFAEGSTATTTRPRLVASATLDALRQLDPAAALIEVDAAHAVRIGDNDVVVVTLVAVAPPQEHRLSGSAIVRSHVDDATIRAVLDATNRRLEYLTARHVPDTD